MCACVSQMSDPIGRLPAYICYNGGWAKYGSEGAGVEGGAPWPGVRTGSDVIWEKTVGNPSMERTTPNAEWLTRDNTQATLPMVNECKQKHMSMCIKDLLALWYCTLHSEIYTLPY